MIKEIESATPGSFSWVDSQIPGRRYDYSVYKSTFPSYSTFFFRKKKEGGLYYGNRKELLSILRKSEGNNKLTKRQGNCIEEIFRGFFEYEADFYEEWGEKLINPII
jgi:hypothetical protein